MTDCLWALVRIEGASAVGRTATVTVAFLARGVDG